MLLRNSPLATVLLSSLGFLVACGGGTSGDDDGGDDDGGGDDQMPDAGPGDGPFPFARCEAGGPLPALVEDRAVYEQDDLEVLTVNVSIADPQAFLAVQNNVEGARAPITFTDGTFGADAAVPNATIQLRGGASRVNKKKNYKIQLTVDGETYLGQREINLNKHMWDLTRLRNKLSFDLFQGVPHLTSLRTRFVRMMVDGEDWGLYTWVEEADKRFLASHGLDPDGQLYKPANFFFQPIDAETLAEEALLDEVIEAKANPDHAKLVRMLDALDDDSIGDEEVIDTYFNRDNLATWLAVNVLVNNIDTITQNYYLYSPSSCAGFYLLPWDYDGAWGFYGQLEEDDRDRWQRGLTNYWASALFKRFFADPANVALVDAKIEELAGTLSDEVVAAQIAKYHDVVEPFISMQPDIEDLPGYFGDAPVEVALDLWNGELERISTTTSRFHAEYAAVIERPMPIFLAYIAGEPHEFRWDRSFDLQGDPLTYDFQLSRTEGFQAANIVQETTGLVDNELQVATLAAGTYYWRVIVRDGKSADSFQLPMIKPFRKITVP